MRKPQLPRANRPPRKTGKDPSYQPCALGGGRVRAWGSASFTGVLYHDIFILSIGFIKFFSLFPQVIGRGRKNVKTRFLAPWQKLLILPSSIRDIPFRCSRSRSQSDQPFRKGSPLPPQRKYTSSDRGYCSGADRSFRRNRGSGSY